LLLATLVLITIWADQSQPTIYPREAYLLLSTYVAMALALTAIAWRGWWLESQLAGPAHAVDIAMFTVVVFLTRGSTSPYFIFCMFVLLSAAIRWSWRATALTAILITLLYVLVGAVTAPQGTFEVNRYVVRTGYLVILSLILIWFGVNQWRARIRGPAEDLLSEAPPDSLPLESGLAAAIAIARAERGAFVWARRPNTHWTTIFAEDGLVDVSELKSRDVAAPAPAPFIYDLARGRALMRDSEGNLRAFAPWNHVSEETAAALRLNEGLAIPVISERGQGQIFLEQVRGLSTDHLEAASEISAAVQSHIQRQALMKAAEENAEARSRLAIARDLHDSVVQFLAGAAFRLEAMKRSEASGRDLTPELDELKELMLQEQTELRSFITALRSGSQIELAELARDLQALANRLSRQWNVQCSFSLEEKDIMVPARLHLDAQQLVREAVANAVRHAGAKNVSIRLAGEEGEVTLDFINDGATYSSGPDGERMPRSIKERVEAAGGAMEISRGMGVTKITVSLPLAGKAA
jgi:signal transduction histidine kinase